MAVWDVGYGRSLFIRSFGVSVGGGVMTGGTSLYFD